jgi:ABC-type sugar transport system permease subunit
MAVAVAKRRQVRGGFLPERLREALVGYGFVALPMGFFLLFFIFPIGYAFYISRYDWQIFRGPFVGWDNYRALYHDSIFWHHAVRNTLVYTLFVVPLEMALGLALAVVVNQSIRFAPSSARGSISRRSRRPRRSSRSRPTSSRPTAS